MSSKRSGARTRGRILVFIIGVILAAALLSGICAGYIFLSTRLNGFAFSDTYTYKIGMDSTSSRGLKTYTYEIGEAGSSDELYINFTVLMEFCGFYESGDRHEYRFILPSDGSQFIVTVGSTRVDMNGNIIYMEAPAEMVGGSLYLPLAFVDRYIEGISIENATETVENQETGEEEEIIDEFVFIIRCNEKNEYRLRLDETKPVPPIDTSALD